jgi:hypothetical protein
VAAADLEAVTDFLKGKQCMADDRTKTGQADRDRINVNEDYELHRSKKFNVSPDALRAAVKAVGPMAEDVRKHLGK